MTKKDISTFQQVSPKKKILKDKNAVGTAPDSPE